jgi:hypothetical protein
MQQEITRACIVVERVSDLVCQKPDGTVRPSGAGSFEKAKMAYSPRARRGANRCLVFETGLVAD